MNQAYATVTKFKAAVAADSSGIKITFNTIVMKDGRSPALTYTCKSHAPGDGPVTADDTRFNANGIGLSE